MDSALIKILGGLGLFLFGMSRLTETLREVADQKIRNLIRQTVNNPTRGAVMGALTTAVVQSSSATTVAAVGFVGAGLISFPESLGIIFGANIGTTITGWMVALLGFKLDLGEVLLPLIFAGALLGLTRRRELKNFGLCLVGFGLIFVGLGILQEGLAGFGDRLTPAQFPPDTISGRLLLVLIGLVITLVTQSSSAGVATALAAVHTGTISLNQAAAMVIGMDVGTTATAALATIGGNVHAKRTGFAHVIYNGLTGVMAFLLLTPYLQAVSKLHPSAMTAHSELVLVGFHTFFNTIGVILVLPVTNRFARFIERVIPERGNPYVQLLDRSLLANSAAALEAVSHTLSSIADALLGQLQRILQAPETSMNVRQNELVHEALEESRKYLEDLSAKSLPAVDVDAYLANIHILDHLLRISYRIQEEQRLRRCRADELLAGMSDKLLQMTLAFLDTPDRSTEVFAAEIQQLNRELKQSLRDYRMSIVQKTAQGELRTVEVIPLMDTARTLRRLAYHLWRIASHLRREESPEEQPEEQTAGSPT